MHDALGGVFIVNINIIFVVILSKITMVKLPKKVEKNPIMMYNING